MTSFLSNGYREFVEEARLRGNDMMMDMMKVIIIEFLLNSFYVMLASDLFFFLFLLVIPYQSVFCIHQLFFYCFYDHDHYHHYRFILSRVVF